MEEVIRFPETIVEIYDDEQIYNVLAICDFKPKNVVFIGSRKLKSKRMKNNLISCLRSLGLDTKCFFFATDMLSLDTVTEEFRIIIEQFPGLIIDLTGGSEVALVSIGMLARETRVGLMRYDKFEERYRNIYNCPVAEKLISSPNFSIQAYMKLMGAGIKDHGHISLTPDELSTKSIRDILNIWDIFSRSHNDWHKLVGFLQLASRRPPESTSLNVSSPTVIVSGDKRCDCDLTTLRMLSSKGLIRNLAEKGSRVNFRFKSELIRSCLLDVGVSLELYVYIETIMSGMFSDVRLSAVIDWDGKMDTRINTVNEIDVLLVKGQYPIFISCKSGDPDVVALNEIKTLAQKFGGGNGRAVLVTMSDVRSENPFLYQRAADMEVTLLDRNDLSEERLIKRLLNTAKP